MTAPAAPVNSLFRPVDFLLLGGLSVLAWLAPLPLYLLALACFGLPHVLWEIRWLYRNPALFSRPGAFRPRYLPRYWWGLLAALLAVQAGGRLLLWLGGIRGMDALSLDLLTLALILLLTLLLPVHLTQGWPRARKGLMYALALTGSGLLGLALLADVPHYAIALVVVLSVAHNFTPVGLIRMNPQADAASRRSIDRLFLLPFGLLLLPVINETGLWGGKGTWGPTEWYWLREETRLGAWSGVLPALVLAQCLHYYAVLRLLPRSLGPHWQAGSQPDHRNWQAGLILAACAGLTLYFTVQFADARRLYAVAAGIHAWLEWPLLLCLLGGLLHPAAASAVSPAASPLSPEVEN